MTFPLLHVQNLSKQFHLRSQISHVIQKISFTLASGEILGLGGESGCGKSTLARMLTGLLQPTSGSIWLKGQKMQDLITQKSQAWRRHIQMIFQHPAASLNPRMTVKEILIEPLIIHNLAKGTERIERLKHLLEQVGLSENYLQRLPYELSGGQKQRVSIARALAVEPELLICDEPFSALDVSVQAQIINLLVDLQRQKNLSYLIISHDLSILRYLTQRLAIMYLGEFVEWGPSQEVYDHPLHPYTQALVSAILHPNPFQKRVAIRIKGDIPKLVSSNLGCPFYSRCPQAHPICQTVKPIWREVKTQHFTACHLYNQ